MSLDRAIVDWKRFLLGGGFEVDITLTPPLGDPVAVKGLGTKHHNSIGTDGLPINSKNVHISLIESDLVEKGITVRDTNGEVNLLKFLVDFTDSSGVLKHYIIKETFPDETVGVITCILGDYGS